MKKLLARMKDRERMNERVGVGRRFSFDQHVLKYTHMHTLAYTYAKTNMHLYKITPHKKKVVRVLHTFEVLALKFTFFIALYFYLQFTAIVICHIADKYLTLKNVLKCSYLSRQMHNFYLSWSLLKQW